MKNTKHKSEYNVEVITCHPEVLTNQLAYFKEQLEKIEGFSSHYIVHASTTMNQTSGNITHIMHYSLNRQVPMTPDEIERRKRTCDVDHAALASALKPKAGIDYCPACDKYLWDEENNA